MRRDPRYETSKAGYVELKRECYCHLTERGGKGHTVEVRILTRLPQL